MVGCNNKRQYNNRVDVRGHKYVFGPSQNHFSPSVARVKISSEDYYNNFKGLLTFNFNYVFQKNDYS